MVFAYSPQELVPLAVTEGVVHGLEVIEVDEEHGQVGAGALRPRA